MTEPWTLTHEQYDQRLAPRLRAGCTGAFRVEEDNGKGPVITRCDGCGQLLGVSRKMFNAGPPAPVTSQMTGALTGDAEPDALGTMF